MTRPRASRLWPIAAMVCVLAVLGAGVALYTIKRASDTADTVVNWPERIAQGAARLFQTKTVISGTSISLPAQDILEMNLVQRRIICFTKQENRLWGSKSVRIIEGVFEVKAGYDLSHGFAMDYSEHDRSIHITLPEPKINSLEVIRQETFHLDSGTIKWEPNTLENDAGNQANREEARREAMELGITDEVRARMEERIRDIFSPFADRITFSHPSGKDVQILPKEHHEQL